MLRRIGDFALGPAAGLFGVLLLGCAVAHLLAPETPSIARSEPRLVASSAGVTRALGVLTVGKVAASGARLGVDNRREAKTVGPSRSPAAVDAGNLTVRRSNERTGAAKVRAEPRSGVAQHPSRVRGEKAVALARLPAPVRRSARARLPAPVANRVRNAVVAHTGLPHMRSLKAHDRPAVHIALRVVLPAHDSRAATAAHGLAARAGASSPHLQGRTNSNPWKSRVPAYASRLEVPRAPLGYDERPVLARIPVAALPAAPIATTPVRGKTPAVRTAVAPDAAKASAPGAVLGSP